MSDEERTGTTPHDRHVAQGYCPVISWSKAWCGRLSGHSGLHGSPRIPNPYTAPGEFPDTVRWVDWHD